MMKYVFLYCLLSLTFVSSVHSQSPVFLVPVSIATIDGSTVEFTCTVTASNTVLLAYFVNGTEAFQSSVVNKGFTSHDTETLSDGSRRRNLTAIASSTVNNNTEIKCTAFGSLITDSNIATLTIQGPLSSVVGLSYYSFIDSSTINISWSPPFTLPGIDISGYNISVTSNSTTMDDFTMDTFYDLLLTDIVGSPCNEIIITVSGYNGLNGENAESTTAPSSRPVIPVEIIIDEQDQLTVNVELSFTDYCLNEFPTSIQLDLFNDNELLDSANETVKSDIVTTTFTVEENHNYTVHISFTLYNGDYTFKNTTSFNTNSAQSVTITNTTTDGTVCLECVFSSFSTASGCTVQLVSTADDNIVQYTGIFARSTSSSTTAGGCIANVITGEYIVSAYGKGSSVVADTLTINVTTTTITATLTISEMTSSTGVSSFTVYVLPTTVPSERSITIVIIGATGSLVSATLLIVAIVIFIVLIWMPKNYKKGDKSFSPTSKNVSKTAVKSHVGRSDLSRNTNVILHYENEEKDPYATITAVESLEDRRTSEDMLLPETEETEETDSYEMESSMIVEPSMQYAEVGVVGTNPPRAPPPSGQLAFQYGTVDHVLTARLNAVSGDTPPALPPKTSLVNESTPL